MRRTTPHQLPPAALALADKPYDPAYSPIVLAGLVRMIEAALVIAVGFIVYVFYVVKDYGFAWYYFAAILSIALLTMLAFQVADIYQVQAFRGHEKQYMRLASAWSVVFLIAIGLSFFAKAGDQFFRAWLGTFYVLGLFALIAFRRGLFLMVRRGPRKDGSIAAPSLSAAIKTANRSSIRSPPSAFPVWTSSARSTTAATSAARKSAPAFPSSARSTIWWNLRAVPASIS